MPGLPVHPPCWSTGGLDAPIREGSFRLSTVVLLLCLLLFWLEDLLVLSLKEIGGRGLSCTISARLEASCAAVSAQRQGVPSEQKPQRSKGVPGLLVPFIRYDETASVLRVLSDGEEFFRDRSFEFFHPLLF